MTLRLAHFSDFHIGLPPRRGEWNAKRLAARANWLLNRRRLHDPARIEAAVAAALSRRPDAAIVTGDIAQTGLPDEFARVGELLSPLTRAGLPVFLVSGNHDLYGGGTRGRDAFAELQMSLRLNLPLSEAGICRVGEAEMLLMDQGYSCRLFYSDGRVDPEQMERLRAAWKPPEDSAAARPLRLALGHYPLAWPEGGMSWFEHLRIAGGIAGLAGAGMLAEALAAARAQAYFCGHLHRAFTARLPGGTQQFCADSTSRSGRAEVYVCGPDGVSREGDGAVD